MTNLFRECGGGNAADSSKAPTLRFLKPKKKIKNEAQIK